MLNAKPYDPALLAPDSLVWYVVPSHHDVDSITGPLRVSKVQKHHVIVNLPVTKAATGERSHVPTKFILRNGAELHGRSSPWRSGPYLITDPVLAARKTAEQTAKRERNRNDTLLADASRTGNLTDAQVAALANAVRPVWERIQAERAPKPA